MSVRSASASSESFDSETERRTAARNLLFRSGGIVYDTARRVKARSTFVIVVCYKTNRSQKAKVESTDGFTRMFVNVCRLRAYVARCRPRSCLSQLDIWFQLAKFWLRVGFIRWLRRASPKAVRLSHVSIAKLLPVGIGHGAGVSDVALDEDESRPTRASAQIEMIRDREFRARSVLAKHRNRIDAAGAPRGDIGGEERHHRQHHAARREGDGITGLDAE